MLSSTSAVRPTQSSSRRCCDCASLGDSRSDMAGPCACDRETSRGNSFKFSLLRGTQTLAEGVSGSKWRVGQRKPACFRRMESRFESAARAFRQLDGVFRARLFAMLFERQLDQPVDQLAERSEEHTSELQSLAYLVCRLLLEKKKKNSKRKNRSNRVHNTSTPTTPSPSSNQRVHH